MIHGGNVWMGNQPGQWLDFSANLRPSGPPAWLTEILEQAVSDVRYYPDPEMNTARSGLAAYLGVPETHVLPTAGGAAAIDLALARLKGPVSVAPVTFSEYAERARVHNRLVCEISSESLSVPPGGTVVLCNPNNPTGEVTAIEKILEQHRACASSGGELLVDEAFIDYCPENSVRQAVSDSLTVIGSLTKLLGIPGVRLGYIVAVPDILAQLQKIQLPWSLNALAAATATALPAHMEEIQADISQNRVRRERFTARLRQLGAEVSPSAANFLLVRFDRDILAFIPRLKARGILVRNCTSFGLDEHYLRLAVRLDEENERLVEELRICLAL